MSTPLILDTLEIGKLKVLSPVIDNNIILLFSLDDNYGNCVNFVRHILFKDFCMFFSSRLVINCC